MAAAAPVVPEKLLVMQQETLIELIQPLINSVLLGKRPDLLQECIASVPDYPDAEITATLTGCVDDVLFDNTRPKEMRYTWRSLDTILRDNSLMQVEANFDSFTRLKSILKNYPSYNPLNLTALQKFYQKLQLEVANRTLKPEIATSLFFLREAFLEMGQTIGKMHFLEPKLIFKDRASELVCNDLSRLGNKLELGDVQNFIKKYVEKKIQENSDIEKVAADSTEKQQKETETKLISSAIYRFTQKFSPEKNKDGKAEKEEYRKRFSKLFSDFFLGRSKSPEYSIKYDWDYFAKCVQEDRLGDLGPGFMTEFKSAFIKQSEGIFGKESCKFILDRINPNDYLSPASIAQMLRKNPELAKAVLAPELKKIAEEQAKKVVSVASSAAAIITAITATAAVDAVTTHLNFNQKMEVAELKEIINKSPAARTLTFDGVWLTAEHIDALGEILITTPAIEKLFFQNCDFQSETFFLKLSKTKNINTLSFNNVKLSPADAEELSKFLETNASITTLEFCNCGLSVDNMHRLLQAIANNKESKLKNLVLTVSKFEHLKEINNINFLDMQKLAALHLINNGIDYQEFDLNYHRLSYNLKISNVKCSCESKKIPISSSSSAAASPPPREIQLAISCPDPSMINYGDLDSLVKTMHDYLNSCWLSLIRYLDLPESNIRRWELFEQKISTLLGLIAKIKTGTEKDKNLELLRGLSDNINLMGTKIDRFLFALPNLVYYEKKEPKDCFGVIDSILDEFIESLPREFQKIFKEYLEHVKQHSERNDTKDLSSIAAVSGMSHP